MIYFSAATYPIAPKHNPTENPAIACGIEWHSSNTLWPTTESAITHNGAIRFHGNPLWTLMYSVQNIIQIPIVWECPEGIPLDLLTRPLSG